MAGYKKNMEQYENLVGWEKLSLGEQLDKWAAQYGDRIAVTDSEEEITYWGLNQKAIRIGHHFMEKGICKKLLLETELSVTEIASKIGYENPNKFTSAFKGMYGCSPTEFRKSVRLDRSGLYGVAKKSELY